MTAIADTTDPARRNRLVLIRLAAAVDPHADPAWVRPLAVEIRAVRDELVRLHTRGEASLPLTTVAAWRTRLQRVLTEARQRGPGQWAHCLEPGGWLDSHLRLCGVLEQFLDQAAADEDAVGFADLHLPDRLGWPAWALPADGEQEAVAT